MNLVEQNKVVRKYERALTQINELDRLNNIYDKIHQNVHDYAEAFRLRKLFYNKIEAIKQSKSKDLYEGIDFITIPNRYEDGIPLKIYDLTVDGVRYQPFPEDFNLENIKELKNG